MALWAFVDCGWCGYTGCAAPIGDACPQCNHRLTPEPKTERPAPTDPAAPSAA
jgi:hypothetical protein